MIIYKEEDFVARVKEITSGEGVEVVYDSVGKDTFQVRKYCAQHSFKSIPHDHIRVEL